MPFGVAELSFPLIINFCHFLLQYPSNESPCLVTSLTGFSTMYKLLILQLLTFLSVNSPLCSTPSFLVYESRGTTCCYCWGFFFNLKLKDYSSFTTWLLHFKLIMVCIEEKKNSENDVNVLFYPVLIIFISIHSVLSKGQSKIQFF